MCVCVREQLKQKKSKWGYEWWSAAAAKAAAALHHFQPVPLLWGARWDQRWSTVTRSQEDWRAPGAASHNGGNTQIVNKNKPPPAIAPAPATAPPSQASQDSERRQVSIQLWWMWWSELLLLIVRLKNNNNLILYIYLFWLQRLRCLFIKPNEF